MNQAEFSCRAVQAWLETIPEQPAPEPIAPRLLEHVRGCARCRGALYAMFAPAVLSAESRGISCEECQDGLAAFVHADSNDALGAIRLYPQVWQHLWLCAECLEAYDILVAVLRDEPELRVAEPRPAGRPLDSPPAGEPPSGHFRPLLEMLRAALVGLPTRAELAGTYRSATIEREFLLRRNQPYAIAGLRGMVKALRESDDSWTIEALVQPAIAGRMRATIGAYRQIVPISPAGIARFSAIPAAELISNTTSLILELDAGEG